MATLGQLLIDLIDSWAVLFCFCLLFSWRLEVVLVVVEGVRYATAVRFSGSTIGTII